MALTPEGESFGTIGGGAVEFSTVEQSVVWLKTGQPQLKLLVRQHHTPMGDQASGQICGGEQSVVYLRFRRRQLPLLQQFERASLDKQHCLFQLTAQGLTCIEANDAYVQPTFTDHGDGEWLYQESLGLRKTAYLIGGGHVALALTQLLILLEFDVIIIDQREAVRTMQQNHWAMDKRVMPFSEIADMIEEGDQTYLLVMTHSHQTDQQVIAALGHIRVGYIGLLGSRRKLQLIKNNLSNRLSQEFWNSLHAPVGLAIHSNTPMEIAVSIAAEMISVANLPDDAK